MINETLILANPILRPIATLIGVIQVLVGGIFGLYLFLVILRWIEYKKLVKLLKNIDDGIKKLNKKPIKKKSKKWIQQKKK